METNPIKIGRGSTWSSQGARFFWIIFCLVLMVGIPLLVWFTARDFYPRTIHNLVFNTPIIGFEVFIMGLLVIFGILPKTKKES